MTVYRASIPSDSELMIVVKKGEAVSLAYSILEVLMGQHDVYFGTDSFIMWDDYDSERGVSLVAFRRYMNSSDGYAIERDQALLFVRELLNCYVEGNMPFVCRIR